MNKNRIYTLEEAGTITGRQPTDVLKLGSEGKLSVCVPVPDNVVVYGTNTELLELDDPGTREHRRMILRNHLGSVRPVAMPNIEFLILTAADCLKVLARGEYAQAVFLSGMRFDNSNNAEIITPPEISSDFFAYQDFPLSRRLACYSHDRAIEPSGMRSKGLPRKIRLALQSLRISIKEADGLRSAGFASKEDVPFNDGFVEMNYMSKRLIAVHRAALAYWNPNAEPPNERTNLNIAKWICKQYAQICKGSNIKGSPEFGNTTAKQFIPVLRASYENWDQKKHDADRAQGYLTPFEALVEVGKGWENADLAEQDTYPKNIKETLMEKHEFFRGEKKYLAEHGMTILRPERAIGGRPKKEQIE